MNAEFFERDACIACQSRKLRTLDTGEFGDEPHRSMLLDSPWGESPFPFLEHCTWCLVECEDCAQVFHLRVLTPEWTERRFTMWMTEHAIQQFRILNGFLEPSARYNRARKIADHVLCIEKLTRSLRGNGPTRLLDFGCGDGEFLALADAFGFETFGVDRSAARTEHYKGPASIYQSLEAFHKDHSEALHVVTLFEVLEHLEDPLAILKTTHERLIPSGLLVVEVPNAEGVTRIKTMDDLVVDGVDHLNAFSPSTIKGIVERAGFILTKRPTAHVTADVPRIIKREIRRIVGPLRKPSTQLYFRRK